MQTPKRVGSAFIAKKRLVLSWEPEVGALMRRSLFTEGFSLC
jgi:hypothetical protein